MKKMFAMFHYISSPYSCVPLRISLTSPALRAFAYNLYVLALTTYQLTFRVKFGQCSQCSYHMSSLHTFKPLVRIIFKYGLIVVSRECFGRCCYSHINCMQNVYLFMLNFRFICQSRRHFHF